MLLRAGFFAKALLDSLTVSWNRMDKLPSPPAKENGLRRDLHAGDVEENYTGATVS